MVHIHWTVCIAILFCFSVVQRGSSYLLFTPTQSRYISPGRSAVALDASARKLDFGDGNGPIEKNRHILLSGDDEYELAKQYKFGLKVQLQSKFLENDFGRPLDFAELAEKLDIPMDKLQLLMDKSETAKKILIRANIRLIFHIAKTYRNKGIPYSDLVQEGTFGLLKAVERYDPDRGFRFSTYSSWWIRQAISRAVAEKSRVVRMPVHIHELLMNVNRVEKQFLAAKSRKPTDVELAELVGISVEKLLGLSEYTKDVGSTEDILFQNNAKGTSSQASVKDTVTSALSSMPKHIAEELTKISDIESVMVDLTEREAEVISMRYGIGGRIFTLEEAGIKLDVTRERIRQIENRAMVKIRPTKEDAMFSSNPTDITEEDMF